MSGLTLTLMLQSTLLAAGPVNYAEAYRQTQADGQPLLVLVGADWCPGCVTMKRGVLPRLTQAGRLKDANLAVVNLDYESDLAGQLMRGGTIPQLIVFAKTPGGWYREQITGATSDASVEALVSRARQAQATASTAGRSSGGATGR
ncbi:MAG TPA: thioredoxin family protein [Pirellulaceae bacterium]|nr:thioredoxin family protein [Pirellulaceae bacterium]